ncbi:MAG: hypothetical protein HZB55_03455 [Deltaproteobacteria bacterium]|nr:hypothetical protein [Deltaproteobacteria bacterium]
MIRYLRATDPGELAALARGGYGGVELGAEFCHRRLPSVRQVREARNLCRSEGRAFSLVTPIVREGAFDAVAAWLAEVAAHLCGDEWVTNDWGLLAWALEQRLPLRPALGRLLGRQRRDARALAMQRAGSDEEANALRGSLWDDPVTAGWVASLGVERVELDLLLQGTRRPSLPDGVFLSLCGPWLPVTLSPSCPWSADPLGCAGPCKGAEPVLLRTAEEPHPLWSRGNTLFVRRDDAPGAAEVESLGADRLVWAEDVPG